MTPHALVVVGAGGFGRETLDVVEAIVATNSAPNFRLLGVADDSPGDANSRRLSDRSARYLGSVDEVIRSEPRAHFVVAVGSPQDRMRITDRLLASGMEPATLIHPRAVVGSASKIGRGSVICAGVQVSTNVFIGDHVHVNANATIGHDSTIGDFVSVNPGAVISGEVKIEPSSLIGAGAVILQGLTIGSGSTIGAAACVVHDVPPGMIAKGVPARWEREEQK